MASENPINTTRKQRALLPRKEPYWHAIRRGAHLGLAVGTSGAKWIARARGLDSKYHTKPLGDLASLTYAQAEDLAREFATQTSLGQRPQNYSVNKAIADYVQDVAVRKTERTALDTQQRLARHVPPWFGKIALSDLRTLDVRAWRDSLVKTDADETDTRRSKDTANRILAMLKASLNLAFRNGLTASDTAWRRVPGFAKVGASRTLFLSPEQVQTLLAATDGAFYNLVKGALLTGARYGELAKAKVSDFDPRASTLHLMRGKTDPRTCYLSSDAASFLRILTDGRPPTARILVRDDGTAWGKSDQQRPMREAIKKAGLPPETVFYSLRHYFISRALLAGIPAQVIAENCGTSIRMIELHYGKFTRTDRQAMFDRVEL